MRKASFSTSNREPLVALFLFLCFSCAGPIESQEPAVPSDTPYLMILGVAQDAGYPQIGERSEFKLVGEGKREKTHAISLCLVDPERNTRYLFEATPDLREQLEMVDKVSTTSHPPFDGIFLTHAHMGHYTGLMHLGFEAMGTNEVPVYAMPRMKNYLETNGPWSQLVNFKNISLKPMTDSTNVQLSENISVLPFTVPHRDEYSETVGFRISVNNQHVVFIPDIDKWERWDVDIREVVKANDIILIDASFFADGELPGRDMSKIPHPFTSESMELFKNLSDTDKAKVYFIHANHSNPILDSSSREYQQVLDAGFHVGFEGQVFVF